MPRLHYSEYCSHDRQTILQRVVLWICLPGARDTGSSLNSCSFVYIYASFFPFFVFAISDSNVRKDWFNITAFIHFIILYSMNYFSCLFISAVFLRLSVSAIIFFLMSYLIPYPSFPFSCFIFHSTDILCIVWLENRYIWHLFSHNFLFFSYLVSIASIYSFLSRYHFTSWWYYVHCIKINH